MEQWVGAMGTPQQVALRCHIVLAAGRGESEASVIYAQTETSAQPEFEVATIKPSSPDARGRFFTMPGVNRFEARNHTLKECVAFAYNVTPALIPGGASWIESERFDIVAQTPGKSKPSEEQVRLMFQTLLADRFSLKLHHEQKLMAGYDLVVGKNGAKIHESTLGPEKPPSMLIQPSPPYATMLPARNVTMKAFAAFMQRVIVDRPVTDRTGLDGRYDFNLEWLVDGSTQAGSNRPPLPPEAYSKPDIFGAVEQLGLKLESTKAIVEILVIDHVEEPSAN